jgi:hypothetical protein
MKTIRNYVMCWWAAPAVAAAVAAFMCGLSDAIAQSGDLEDGVTKASSELKKIIKIGAVAAAAVIVVGGLLLAAFKFTQKDPNAVWYFVGTVAGGALCGIAAGML